MQADAMLNALRKSLACLFSPRGRERLISCVWMVGGTGVFAAAPQYQLAASSRGRMELLPKAPMGIHPPSILPLARLAKDRMRLAPVAEFTLSPPR